MGTTTTLLTESASRLAGSEQVKHTPGPWSVGRSCDNTPAVTVPCPDSSGFVVAHINRLPKLGLVPGNADANAHLIAAAPEMLAALKALAADYTWSTQHLRGGYAESHPIIAAHAAIAKAEGRTP